MACQEAPALITEKQRLQTIGGSFLGIIGDANHSFGYHLCNPPTGDYSRAGTVNTPVGEYACAIDIGMNWAASRQWLPWLITQIRSGHIKGIAEVIGSLDGRNVRYWSDASGWAPNGVAYTGTGHDTWTHVAINRSTARQDHGILAGWTATGYQGGVTTMADDYGPYGKPASVGDRTTAVMLADLWMQNAAETSPYAANSPSKHTKRLIDVHSAVTDIKAGVVQIVNRPAVVLDENQIALIAQQVTIEVVNALVPMIGAAVTDEIARRLQE